MGRSRPKIAPIYTEALDLLAVVSLCDAMAARVAEARAVSRAPLREHTLERAWRLRDDAIDRLNGVPIFNGRMRARCDALRDRIGELTQEIEAASLALTAPPRDNVLDLAARRATRKAVIR